VATVLLIARLVLAGLFAVAGVAKLADGDGSRSALAGFGVGRRLAAPLALAVPLLELTAAGLLLPAATARWGGLIACGLLIAFSAGIALALGRGGTSDCHCFGRLHSSPAGRTTLLRNAALGALASFVMIAGWRDGGSSPVRWLAHLSSAGVVALVGGVVLVLVVAGGGALLVTVLRQHGRLLLRVKELEATLAPDLAQPEAAGFCEGMLADLRAWEARSSESSARLLVVSTGTPQASRALGLRAPVLHDPNFSAAPAFGASGTPSAVLLDEEGVLASEIAVGAQEILALAEARTPTPAGAAA